MGEQDQQERGSTTLHSGRGKWARKTNKNVDQRNCTVEGASGRGRPTRTWINDIAQWKGQVGEEDQQERGSTALHSGRGKWARKTNKNVDNDIAQWKGQVGEEHQQERGSTTLHSGRGKWARKTNKNVDQRNCTVEGASGRGRPTRTWINDIAQWKGQVGEEDQQERGSTALHSGRGKWARKTNKNVDNDIAQWKGQVGEEHQQERGSTTLHSGRGKWARKTNKNTDQRHCTEEGASGRGRPTRTWINGIAQWKGQVGEEPTRTNKNVDQRTNIAQWARKTNKNVDQRTNKKVEGASGRGRPARTWINGIAQWKGQVEEDQQERG